jgi:hypothetical protein
MSTKHGMAFHVIHEGQQRFGLLKTAAISVDVDVETGPETVGGI